MLFFNKFSVQSRTLISALATSCEPSQHIIFEYYTGGDAKPSAPVRATAVSSVACMALATAYEVSVAQMKDFGVQKGYAG